MADTMVFALVGSLIVTLTLLPVLCAWFMRNGVRERRNAAFEAIKSRLHQGPRFLPRASLGGRRSPAALLLARVAAAHPAHRRRVHAAAGRRRAVGARDHALHHLVRRIGEDRARRCATILRSFPEVTTVASELGRPDDGTDPTGFFNVEFYVGLKPYSQWTRRVSQQGRR